MWKAIERFIVKFLPNNQGRIIERLKELNLRIESSTNEDTTPSTAGFAPNNFFGISFIQKKTRSYPLASVRQIEQELSWIFDEIERCGSHSPRFIIVFDEIDKIDPAVNINNETEADVLPEYENIGSGFVGGATSRRRKQNLMRLLANMKFFISTAKAKFIFIAGRELYDAFLADASDREFAVGSIFNNVIYVDSFLNSGSNPKDITKKTEQYISKQLLPHIDHLETDAEEHENYYTFKTYVDKLKKEFILDEVKELQQLVNESPENALFEKEIIRLWIKHTPAGIKEWNTLTPRQAHHLKEIYRDEHTRYLDTQKRSFRLAYHLLHLATACKQYIQYKNKGRGSKDKTHNALLYFKIKDLQKKQNHDYTLWKEENKKISFLNKLVARIPVQNETGIISIKEKIDLYLYDTNIIVNKTTIMLQHFSLYLSHVSIGAPKKISIHFEKYLKTKEEADNNKKPKVIIPCLSSKEPEFYLAFSYKTQQKIGFIHYMAFPLINALLDNASIYGDKLLISGCFLTNHIYKYHNNGFSWRNLENIPELLDINKSPELREFINVIISYLTRSHLSSAINGVYHFKFPMKITEEISIMSKLSEEVSALFNFSLDDSLSVKRHYFRLLEHYTGRYNPNGNIPAGEGDAHHIVSGIHQILGDLHLLDEQYNEALFEYQCGIESLLKDEINNNNSHYPAHMLSLVRIMLKLGLTYEKRKTYNTAYITYNQLIAQLIEYRYIDETELGLTYSHQTRDDLSWKDKRYVLEKKQDQTFTEKKRYQTNVQPLLDGQDTHFKFRGEELIAQFNKELTPTKNSLIVRLTMFEDVRLIYQALLARLFVLEKKGLGGITKENIEMLESDFTYLHRFVYYKEKYMISADFFRRLADILYYKNGLVNLEAANSFFMMLYFWDYNVENDFYNYCLKNGFEKYTDDVQLLLKIQPAIECEPVSPKTNAGTPHKVYLAHLDYKQNFFDFFNSNEFRLEKILAVKAKKGYAVSNDQWQNLKRKDQVFLNRINHTAYQVDKVRYIILNDTVSVNTWEEKMKNEDFSSSIHFTKKIFLTVDIKENTSAKASHVTYSKVDLCKDRRKKLLGETKNAAVKNKRTPCYACKYYNRTLKIIMKNMLGKEEIEHNYSKVIFFMEARHTRNYFYSLKDNDVFVLASTLDGMGNVLFSCSEKEDKIQNEFMINFTNMIRVNDDAEKKDAFVGYKGKLSHLEKALLYFWTASFYYKYSSNKKEAYLCMKKTLYLFVNYLEIRKKENDQESIDIIAAYLPNIRQHIFSRAMQNLYSHYENTNMVEIQKVKWVYGTEMYGTIPLNELSIFPDAEEMILLYYKMELLSGSFSDKQNDRPTIYNLYKNMPLGQYRIENTVSERIVALSFKAGLNLYILKQLLPYSPESLFSYTFMSGFYEKYHAYLAPKAKLKEQLGKYAGFLDPFYLEANTAELLRVKMDLIEFLVIDSIFCLSKIIEAVSPINQTTLFTESYIANVYDQLFEYNQVYECLYLMYKHLQNEDKSATNKRIKSFIKARKKNNNVIPENFTDTEQKKEIKRTKEMLKNIGLFIQENGSNELTNDSFKTKTEDLEGTRSERFFTMLLKHIGKADIHMNITNYHAEMALEKYKKAIEMHREGKCYQDMISNMYLIEDDLNNNTCQFYFAIERYNNNCGVIDDRITHLKSICKVSSLLNISNYTKNDPTVLT